VKLDEDYPVHAVVPNRSGDGIRSVLPNTARRIARDPDIERAAASAHEDAVARTLPIRAPTVGLGSMLSGSFRGDDGCYLRSAAFALMWKQRVAFLTDHQASIASAIFSAVIKVGKLVSAQGNTGNSEASTTRKPATLRTRP
jgi:hypothetical protein